MIKINKIHINNQAIIISKPSESSYASYNLYFLLYHFDKKHKILTLYDFHVE